MSGDPYKYFRIEARELLDQLGSGVLELEKSGSDPELVQRLLRLAHTLKGAARVVKQREIGERAHAIEDALQPLRDKTAAVAGSRIEALLEQLDRIDAELRALGPASASEPPPARRPAADENVPALRAETTELDQLLTSVAEAHVQLGALARLGDALERSRHLSEVLGDQLAVPGRDPDRGRDNQRLRSLADELRGLLASVEREFARGVDQTRRELLELGEAAEQLRLVPARSLFVVLERTARDVAQALGKQVSFECKGGEVRLDAQVLEGIQGALVQLVRNAVAHGIEFDAERRAAGKPAAGQVGLDVVRRGRRVLFRCRDDGRGIDLDAVRRAAARRGFSDDRAARGPGVNELARLLLRGGISTSRNVTELAGRGIGLDVVREAAERLGAEVSVVTEPGAGTRFELLVPLSLASLECLIVAAAGRRAAVPLDAVTRTLRVGPQDLSNTDRGPALARDDRLLPLLSLERALGHPSPPGAASRARSAVVLESGAGAAALAVDRLLGTATVVLRPLPADAPADPVVAGVSIDAEGNPELVLDPEGLIRRAHSAEAVAPDAPRAVPRILVIDDSLTTRMLEQSILESAGYEVDTAVSAEAGLESARDKRYALFLVDVEMPGMDGFTFVERVRADPELGAVPAVLVTSRAAPADLERGRQVGAQGYIIKGEFDQAELLGLIRRLLE